VEKRGRFITNIGFANFVTAAVDSGDDRIKGSCMVILKRVIRASSIVARPPRKWSPAFLYGGSDLQFARSGQPYCGGYDIKDGVLVPRYSHSEVIEAVFRRTRVTGGVMTAAKLLSAVEPVIRYQRGRFRGAARPPLARYATRWVCRHAKMPCIGWWMCGPRGRRARRLRSQPREHLTNWTHSSGKPTASSRSAV